MNEKIKEIFDRSNEESIADWKKGIRYETSYEKFAELIVRECADACYKHKDVESFGIYPIRVAMVTKACSDNIKQHFGVEE